MEQEQNECLCPHCGAKLVEYRHSLNKGIAAFVLALYKHQGPQKTDDLGLTFSQRTNSTKAQYWGLVEPVLNDESRLKAGWWKITPIGIEFASGARTMPKYVVVRRHHVLRFEGPEIAFKDVSDGYLYRADYKSQARDSILGCSEASQSDLFE
jgi:hypothetical protein